MELNYGRSLAVLCSAGVLSRWLVVFAVGLLSDVPLARAQSSVSLSGRWQADPMTVRWVIGDWGPACGPRPSGGGDTGGVVEIELKGAELVISSPEGSYSTAQCWAMHPELERQSHAAGGRSWATTCRTRSNDARQEVLQTNITATDDTISFRESGQYQFALQGQTCSASSGRWRTYRRLAEGSDMLPATGPATPPAPVEAVPEPREVPHEVPREVPHEVPREAPPETSQEARREPPRRPATANRCLNPGPPARIEVRPARKLMRPGESSGFRAAVFDVRGCALRTPVSWALSPPEAVAQLAEGVLEIPAGAIDAEFSVVATAANQSVRVGVEVVSSARYSALLASGNFTADGASIEAATATITEGSFGAQSALTEGATPGRKWTFVALVSVIALSFAMLGAFLLKRANRQRRVPVSPRPAAVDVGTVIFSGEERQPPPAAPTGEATRFEPLSQPAPVPPVVSAAMVCPICGTLYPTRDSRACPKDGAQLLPVNA